MSLWLAQVEVCGINAEVLEVQQGGYPDLQIAHLEWVLPRKDGGESPIDVHSEFIA